MASGDGGRTCQRGLVQHILVELIEAPQAEDPHADPASYDVSGLRRGQVAVPDDVELVRVELTGRLAVDKAVCALPGLDEYVVVQERLGRHAPCPTGQAQCLERLVARVRPQRADPELSDPEKKLGRK